MPVMYLETFKAKYALADSWVVDRNPPNNAFVLQRRQDAPVGPLVCGGHSAIPSSSVPVPRLELVALLGKKAQQASTIASRIRCRRRRSLRALRRGWRRLDLARLGRAKWLAGLARPHELRRHLHAWARDLPRVDIPDVALVPRLLGRSQLGGDIGSETPGALSPKLDADVAVVHRTNRAQHIKSGGDRQPERLIHHPPGRPLRGPLDLARLGRAKWLAGLARPHELRRHLRIRVHGCDLPGPGRRFVVLGRIHGILAGVLPAEMPDRVGTSPVLLGLRLMMGVGSLGVLLAGVLVLVPSRGPTTHPAVLPTRNGLPPAALDDLGASLARPHHGGELGLRRAMELVVERLELGGGRRPLGVLDVALHLSHLAAQSPHTRVRVFGHLLEMVVVPTGLFVARDERPHVVLRTRRVGHLRRASLVVSVRVLPAPSGLLATDVLVASGLGEVATPLDVQGHLSSIVLLVALRHERLGEVEHVSVGGEVGHHVVGVLHAEPRRWEIRSSATSSSIDV